VLDGRGFESRQGLGTFLFTTASRPPLRPIQLPIQCVPGALSLGVKRPGCEVDHSPPSSAEVKECVEVYLHSPNTPSWRGDQFKKSQGQLYLYLFTRFITAGTFEMLYHRYRNSPRRRWENDITMELRETEGGLQ
jgi:hypothetical protein